QRYRIRTTPQTSRRRSANPAAGPGCRLPSRCARCPPGRR
ncbi:hypothetical protein AZZ86_004751, partial [Klebsiella pneumoniae]